MTYLLHLDTAALLWINGFSRHSYLLDHIAVSLVGQELLQGTIFFLFLWWLWFRNLGNPIDDRIDVIRIIVAICIADLLARVLQSYLPARVRPINDPSLNFIPPFTEWPSALESWSSFPSDHAIVYYALATAIWVRYRWVGAVAFAWVTVFCSLVRIYTGLHYPGDIITGAVIGILVMRLADACPIPNKLSGAIKSVLAWEARHPAPFYVIAVLGTFEFMSMCDDARVILRGLVSVIKNSSG